MPQNRRDLLLHAGVAVSTLALVRNARAAAPAPWAQAAAGSHAVVPLPFAADKLKGLSAKMLTSHHENNYAGAIKNLNKVELELAKATKDTPAFAVAGLRQSELQFRNSAALHELYFGNLGGDGKVAGSVAVDVAAAFGSAGRFDEQFRQAAAGLYGGSGWVTLGLDTSTRALTVSATQNHTQAAVATLPLLVMDMYEHSYQMDFGAAAARYVDAFMENVAWEEVDRRHQKARAVLALLHP